MADLSIGTTDVKKVALGTMEVQKISVGDTLIWSAATVPSAPRSLSQSPDGLPANQRRLSWTAPSSTGGAPILGYRVESRYDTIAGPPHVFTSWSRIKTTSSTTTLVSRQGGGNTARRHQFRVRAYNSVGNGAPSNTVAIDI